MRSLQLLNKYKSKKKIFMYKKDTCHCNFELVNVYL